MDCDEIHCRAMEHLHSAIHFVTSNKRHGGQDRDALTNRAILYANARAQEPERWSGKTRNGQPAGPVWPTPKTKSAPLKSETPHEIGGQLL